MWNISLLAILKIDVLFNSFSIEAIVFFLGLFYE